MMTSDDDDDEEFEEVRMIKVVATTTMAIALRFITLLYPGIVQTDIVKFVAIEADRGAGIGTG